MLPCIVVALSAHAQAPAVATRALSEVAVYLERDAPAQTVALNESRIAAEITARIEAVPAAVGSRIARGAVIARLDCRDYELAVSRAAAALEAARSRLALSEQQLARARDLQERKFLSAEALAGRETEARVLRAETEQARAALAAAERGAEKCVVRAPFEAIVRQRLADVGELAVPGTPLVVLLDAVNLEVAAQVQVRDAPSLRAARAVRFEGDGGGRALKLLRVSPAIDPQARTVEARLAFAREPAAPGAAGRIIWRDAQPHVPAALVVRRGGRLGVF
ncbi:MAG TPA: efflux RND transporter periplasmic adaptor subunit, partial [Burkholderiales bacterium]|nr:efflux RND transporter periplasmic adaptor subunit [Burkholderiales bacterium]